MTRDLYSNLHYKEVKCLVARLKNARGLFAGWARGSWLFFQVTSMFSLWCILNHELLEVFLCKRIIACRQLLSAANLQAKNRGWIKCHSRFIFSRCNSMHSVRWSVKKTSLLKTTTTFPISYSLHPGSKPDKSPSETGQAPPGVALSATGPAARIRVRGSCSSTKDEEQAWDVSAWGLLLRGLCPGCPRWTRTPKAPPTKPGQKGITPPPQPGNLSQACECWGLRWFLGDSERNFCDPSPRLGEQVWEHPAAAARLRRSLHFKNFTQAQTCPYVWGFRKLLQLPLGWQNAEVVNNSAWEGSVPKSSLWRVSKAGDVQES